MINQGIGPWPPSEMNNMSLDEFDQWVEIAITNLKEKQRILEENQ